MNQIFPIVKLNDIIVLANKFVLNLHLSLECSQSLKLFLGVLTHRDYN